MRLFLLFAFLINTSLLHAQQWNWAVDAGGGGNTDFCFGVATDSQGNAYWCGSVSGTAAFGCATLTPGENVVGVLAKYDVNGVCQWVRPMGTTFDVSWTYAVAIDADDRIYVTGSYDGNATFGNGITLSSMGSDDIFLARYTTEGECLWARQAGSSASSDEARGLAVSDDGGVFLCGYAGGSSIRFDTLEVVNPGNSRQIVVARFDSTGTVQWGKASTGTGQGKSARSIATAGDRIFITGQVLFSNTVFDGMPLTPNANSANLYVLACDLDGNALWTRSFGHGDHEGMDIAADTLGNLFIAGRIWGEFPLPEDTLVSVSANDDLLVMALDQEGGFRWAHSAGSAQRDVAWGIEADGQGNAYFAGHFNSTIDLFGTPLTALGSEDVVIGKLDNEGELVWAARPSGVQRDIALCLHRRPVAPHDLFFGGYYWGTITYGSTTIQDTQNGDAMMVMGVDTTFDVSLNGSTVCPGACDGEAFAFVNGSEPFTYAWNIGATTQGITGLCAGEYIVEVIDGEGHVIVDTIVIATAVDPGLTVQQQDDSLWVDGGSQWQWYLDSAPIAGAEEAQHVAQVAGAYHATYEDVHGCAWSTDTIQVVLNVGLGTTDIPTWIVWPNPSRDLLHLPVGTRVQAATAMDVLGRSVTLPVMQGDLLDVRSLTAGAWSIRMSGADGMHHVRFVKE